MSRSRNYQKQCFTMCYHAPLSCRAVLNKDPQHRTAADGINLKQFKQLCVQWLEETLDTGINAAQTWSVPSVVLLFCS